MTAPFLGGVSEVRALCALSSFPLGLHFYLPHDTHFVASLLSSLSLPYECFQGSPPK